MWTKAQSTTISKPSIIITSLGRTGTKFFAALFKDILADATSLHEPDVLHFFQYKGTRERAQQTVNQLEEVGFYNLFFRKALRFGNIIELSDSRVRGKLESSTATRAFLRQRRRFIKSRPGSIYVESSIGYYGLIDILHNTLDHHKVIYLVREGRDWVRSNMNWGQMYGKNRLRQVLAHTWPSAAEIKGDPHAERWNAMSRFEKLCWAWAKLNKYALDSVQRNPNARVFRFEEIFKAESQYEHLADLVDFATDIPGVNSVPTNALEGWLDRRIHSSSGTFPDWTDWSEQQKRQFSEICGPLMAELDYEFN